MRPNALDVTCSTCGAYSGERCISLTGPDYTRRPHPGRAQEARTAMQARNRCLLAGTPVRSTSAPKGDRLVNNGDLGSAEPHPSRKLAAEGWHLVSCRYSETDHVVLAHRTEIQPIKEKAR